MTMRNSAFTTQREVLDAVVARIQAQVTELNADNLCFISLDEDPSEEVRQNIFATVGPIDGEFDQEQFDGAGCDGVREKSGFVVTVYSAMKLDRPDEQTNLLMQASRGLLKLKLEILRAILRNDDGTQWMPTNTAGASLLTDYIAPVRAGFPLVANSQKHGKLSIAFSANWMWDLT